MATAALNPVTEVPKAKKVRRGRSPLLPYQRNEGKWGIFFLFPALVLIAVFVVYPVIGSFQIALYNWNGINPTTYVGFRHFQEVINDKFFWNAFRNTVMYTAILVPIQLSLALVLAIILNNQKMRFRTIFRTAFFLPAVTSAAVIAIIVRLILTNGSTALSNLFGIYPPISPIGDPNLSFIAVVAFGIWHTFGLNMILFLAALQTVPSELYDAAKIDGADELRSLLNVTLPGIRPVVVIILFLAIAGSLQVFEESYILTGGGPFYASEVVGGYIYTYAFGGTTQRTLGPSSYGYAASAAFFMSLLLIGIAILQYFVVGMFRQKEENTYGN